MANEFLKELESVLEERDLQYGDSSKQLKVIANLWETYLYAKDDKLMSEKDVANMMILLKVARSIASDHKDNQVDIAGYSALISKLNQAKPDEPASRESVQLEAVQLAAVKENGYAIQYIDNPSEEVQLAAIKRNVYSIEYINNPSEAIQLAAVKAKGGAIEYIKNPSEAIQLEAVKRDLYAISYIKNPSEAVQLAAVKNSEYAIEYIKNPSKRVKQLHRELYGNS